MASPLIPPVYMFAADHRWQWTHWCDTHHIDRERIVEVKSLVADAFLLARRRSVDARISGVLLIDLDYGRDAFTRAQQDGAIVGTPAERAGVFPLEWTDAFTPAAPGTFVKVLVRHRADEETVRFESQVAKLLELQQWCRASQKTLVLEILISAERDDEAFEREGRPRLLSECIRTAYTAGLVPDYWKLEGTADRRGIRIVDEAIAGRPAKLLILGKGADLATIDHWFAAAGGASTAAGFAIGRTIYWDAAGQYLLGEISSRAAVDLMAVNYETIIEVWRRAHGSYSGAHVN